MTTERVKVCEWCGEAFVGRGERFCGKAHLRASLNANDGDRDAHLQALQEGHRRYRAEAERVKAERGLLDVAELLERLRRAGVPRSPGAVSGHLRDGLLERERDLGFDKPYLFTPAAADAYIGRLRGYGDGRLVRFNATTPEQAKGRATLYLARHKTTAEFGRVATVMASADARPGRPRELTSEQEARILELREKGGKGASVRAIAQNVGVDRGRVERFLKRETVTKPPLAP